MTARVNPTDVKVVLPSPVAMSDGDIQLHIDIANRFVDGVLSGTDLGEVRLSDIERYVSAHLVAISEQELGLLIEKEIGETRSRFGGTFPLAAGLKFTRFGHMALALDTTGKLAATGKPAALFRVV